MYARVAEWVSLIAIETPAATPALPDLGIDKPIPPPYAAIVDSSSAAMLTPGTAAAVVVTLTESLMYASVRLWILLIDTDPPSANDPAAAPATVMLVICPV